MIKLIAVLYIKLVSIYLGISSIVTGIYLQVIPPEVKKAPLVSEAVQLAFLNMLGLVGVAFFTNWKSNKIKNEVVAVKSEVVAVKDEVVAVKTKVVAVETEVNTVKTEVSTVKTGVGDVHKEVEVLKVNTDGKLNKLMEVSNALSEKIGFDKGKEISKAEHEAQSKKDKDTNIAKGKVEGLAEAKAEQAAPSITPVKVEIVQPEDKPAPVTVVEKEEEKK